MIGLGLGLWFKKVKNIISGITPGWDLYVADNTGTPLNTANALDGTTTPLSTITFDDLTGVTITSQSGTGTYAISGNTIICTSAGTLYNLVLSNGAEFQFTEGAGNLVFSNDGTMSAILSDFTWLQGQAAGTQTALIDYGRYYLGAITSGTKLIFNTPIPAPTAGFDSYFEVLLQVPTDTALNYILHFTPGTNSYLYFQNNSIKLRLNGTIMGSLSLVSISDGKFHKFRFQRVQGEGIDLFVDDVFMLNFANEIDFLPVYGLGHNATNAGYGWVAAYVDNNGTRYDYSNNWGGGYTKSGTWKNVLIPQVGTSGLDAIGQTITNPKLTYGYNFSGQDHWFDSGVTLTRIADTSDGWWFQCQNTEGGDVYASDDILEIGSSATNYLQATFNGVTLVSTQLLEFGEWYYVKFTQDGAGVGNIYVGTRTASPTLVTTGAVGLPTAASTNYLIGK